MSEWIPVTERVPEHGGTVVCRTRDRQLAFGRAMRWCEQRGGERHEKYHWMGYPDGSLDVTHWMPLPEPPRCTDGATPLGKTTPD